MVLAAISVYIVALYFIIVFIIGYLSSRRESREGFLIGDRSLGHFSLASTICAGFIGGGFLVLFVGIAYTFGLSAIWLTAGQALGLVFFAMFGKKIKEAADEKKFYTLADYFYDRYDRKTGLLLSAFVFLFFLAFIAVQFIASGLILSGISGWSYGISVLLVGAAIMSYMLLGGFKAVVKTDVFQFISIAVLMAAIVFSLAGNVPLFPAGPELFSIGAVKALSFMIFGAFFVIIAADVWQRAYAAKSVRVMRKGFLLAAVFMLALGFLGSLLGIMARSLYPSITPENALVASFSGLLSPFLAGLALVLLFSAIMSTLDTLVFVAAMSVSNDLLPRLGRAFDAVRSTKAAIFIVCSLGVLISLLVKSVIAFAFLFTACMLALSPIII